LENAPPPDPAENRDINRPFPENHQSGNLDRIGSHSTPLTSTLARQAGWFFLLTSAAAIPACRPSPRSTGPFPQDAYVWQREWTSNVVSSVRTHRDTFQKLVILTAEVSWIHGEPKTVLTRPDWTAIASANTNASVGLALRIGAFSGPFGSNHPPAQHLIQRAAQVLSEARSGGVSVSELQLDFDCAESRLDGYRAWVEAIRPRIAPVRLRITALPSWLDRSAFGRLVAATDGFVLQVHSLVRPKRPDDPTALCDPPSARAAVERAARAGGGIPFQVALPTYGYLIAFGANGQYLGASAEGSFPSRPEGTTFRELSADAPSMAQLVVDWTHDRPAAMEGIVWYRLPVETDRFNWRWKTLETVLSGRVPTPEIQASLESPQPGLSEVVLQHTGSLDYSGPASLQLRWSGAQRIGADGILGFEPVLQSPTHVLFTNAICRLRVGERSRIGWVRLNAPVPITLETLVPACLQPAE